MVASPIAWADDDHGGHGGGGDDHGRDNVVVQVNDKHDDNRGEDRARVEIVNQAPAPVVVRHEENENEIENENEVEHVNAVNREAALTNALVSAANKEVATLGNLAIDDDEMQLDVEHVRTVSLANLVSGLTAADAAAVTAAVNANAAALQTFLAGGTMQANLVKQLLTMNNLSTSGALAILSGGEDSLIIVTA